MRSWNLHPGVRLPIILCADMRLGATDYCNDQIWELNIGKGEPPALSLMTTYGLRARMLRVFPRFVEGDNDIIDPGSFASPVSIRQFFPNLIKLSFSPFKNINVEIEYWVPGSQVIAARTKISNLGQEPRKLRIEWAVILNPLPGGQRMVPAEIGLNHLLLGKTEGVSPVFYMSGGARSSSGPFTSLELSLELLPKSHEYVTWALGSLGELHPSFRLAQQILERNWEAEMARIARVNSNQLEIYTGDPDWDLAFTLSQYRANSLLLQGTDQLKHPSFVSNRLPDQGFSYRGDGSDYSHQWNGQTPLETFHILDFLLPANVEVAQGLLLNFLSSQAIDGFIDWKPGLTGHRSQILATPLLTSIAWRIYQITQDVNFLKTVFSQLLAFVQHWFSIAYDKDGDGIPEWYHPMQTGLDEHPLFSVWEIRSQGIKINTVESPDLCAFLYQECNLLAQIARLVDRHETIPALEALADHLRSAVEAAWDEDLACYHYWDRESHDSSKFELLGTRHGAGELAIHRAFERPVRLHVEIHSSDESTRPMQIYLHGSAPSGGHRVEKIDSEDMRWHLGRCRVTSERIYAALEHIELQGLNENDEVTVHTVGLNDRDITTLLPLWAGIPGSERAQQLIKRTITNPKVFWGRFGIRSYAEIRPKDPTATRHYKNVSIPYSTLIGYGLIRYGQITKAVELVTHMMKAVIQSIHQEGAFHRVYHPDSGQGSGERNSLGGLPPLGLFLEALGVRIVNRQKVILSGTNPFPWPVTVKYNGLSILRQKSKTMVVFPDGQTITIKNGKTQELVLE